MPSSMWMLNVVSRCAALYQADRLQGTDLKPPHCPYILTLCRCPGISQDQLAKKIFVNKSQVTRQLTYLEQQGYVTRAPGEDKRVLLVYPTQKAEEILPVVRGILKDWNEWLLGGFSEEEQQQFSGLLERAKNRAASYVRGGDDLPPMAPQKEETE